ncbi:uncharacterized protein LOC112022794 [Quercus suber]|uniref:uncharacterized protein LOC112022794 n=1 Tax=Quercus suber TaxID=58331 RepID=UPI000CE1BBA5|nr:uncharacterized protein LOC112022794 [Quercus suber]
MVDKFQHYTNKSAIHVLWECLVAQDVWAVSVRRLQKGVGGQCDFRQLMEELLLKLPTEELKIFLVQAWLLWTQRNSVIHGGNKQDPSQLAKRATKFLEEFKQSHEHLTVQTSVARCSRWNPPPGASFKLNFDVAIFQDIDALGFGAIIRNGLGEVMASI